MLKVSVLIALSLCCFGVCTGQFGGSISTNPGGGQNVNLMAGKSFGTPRRNFGGGVFANGNTRGGAFTRGAYLDANRNGNGISLQHSKTPGQGSTFQQSANVNLLQHNNHNLGANAFHSRTRQDNGFKYNRFGGALNYNHDRGHSASLGVSRIPQLKMNTVDLSGKANLWRSPNRQTSLDLTGGVSKHFGGPFNRQVDKHIGLGMTHHFG